MTRTINRTRLMIAGLSAALGLAVAAPMVSHAHGGAGGPGHERGVHGGGFHKRGGGDFVRKLNLTEAQRDKIFELRHAAAPNLRAKGKEMRAARQEARQLAMADTFDEKRAVTLSNQAARAEAEHSLMRLRLKHQIYGVLTPEQRKQATEMRNQRFERNRAEAPAVDPTV